MAPDKSVCAAEVATKAPPEPSSPGDLTVEQVAAAFNARGDFILIFLSPVFFTLFFGAFALAALTHVPIKAIFPSHRGLAATIMAIGDDTFDDKTRQFKRIQTTDDALQWLTQSFVPMMFPARDATALAAMPSTLRARIATYQKVVGALELCVFSAPPIACSSSNELSRIYDPCHDFNAFPVVTPWYIPPNSPRDDILDWLSTLQANGGLISPSTSSVHLTIPTYNGELDLLCVVSLRINFQSGGFVDTKYKLTSIPLDPYGNHQMSVDALVLLFVALTLGLEYRKYRQVVRTRHRRFWSPWRVVTWLVLVAVGLFYACWAVLCALVYDLSLHQKIITLDDPTLDIDANVKLFETYVGDILASVTSMDYVMIALRLVAMVWQAWLDWMCSILGSLRFHPRLNVVTATLVKSLQELMPFCFVFVVCLSAFVVSGCLLFGDNVKQFSSASVAYVTVVNMLFGQFDLGEIFEVNYYFAVVWYWSAMVVLFLVLFNLFFAVVLEAFYREHSRAETQAAPYAQAITDLQRAEGPWLWPWARQDMAALGRAVKARHLTAMTVPAIAIALNLSDDQAKAVLAKAKAFTKVMEVFRHTKASGGWYEPNVQRVHHQLGEVESRIALMVARAGGVRGAMSKSPPALRRSLSTYEVLTVKDVVEAYHSRKEFKSIFVTPLVYVLFFIFFASAALTHVPIETMFPSQNGLSAALITTGSDTLTPASTMKFKNIQSQADVFAWLTDTFVPSVFVHTDYNNASIPFEEAGRIASFHMVVGAVEVKPYVAPVVPCDASVSLSPIYKTCHDYDHVQESLPWYLASKAPPEDILGWVQDVKSSRLLVNTSTTALHINVATYNGELNLLCITALQIKFEPGGFVNTKSKMTSIPLDPYGGGPSNGALDFCTAAFFVATVVMEYRKIARHRKKNSLIWTKWRTVTWMSLASVLTFYVFWAILTVMVDDDGLKHAIVTMEDPDFDFDTHYMVGVEYFIDIMSRMKTMGTIMLVLRLSAMAAMCLLMFRILGSLRFHPGLNVVMATLTKSFRSLASFFIVFVVCLSAFVLSGCLLFGDSTKAFGSIGMSYVTVVNMLFGQFDPDLVLGVNYYTAVVWYWSAMVVLFLVLFNMLLAIVIDSFEKVHSRTEKRSAPYFAAISGLARHEGPWLWPWSHRDMKRLGRAVKTKELTDVSPTAIANHLAISKDQARRLLMKVRAFKQVMDVLRESQVEGEDEEDPSTQDLSNQLVAMQAQIAALVARLDSPV